MQSVKQTEVNWNPRPVEENVFMVVRVHVIMSDLKWLQRLRVLD